MPPEKQETTTIDDMAVSKVIVCAASSDPDVIDWAEKFAAAHGLPCRHDADHKSPSLRLVFSDERLELCAPGDKPGRGVSFGDTSIDLRTGTGNLSRKQSLPKAIGKDTKTVVDATAGLGHDATLLAAMGYEVTAIERSPIVAALLEDGLRRALELEERAAVINGRLKLMVGDARTLLSGVNPAPEAIYVDPMYPTRRKKSALAKKHIRLVRQLVGADPDAAELVAAARQVATRRVVVKRPNDAEALAGEPDLSFGGKLVRYDVYLRATV